jgi:hypothetical protein
MLQITALCMMQPILRVADRSDVLFRASVTRRDPGCDHRACGLPDLLVAPAAMPRALRGDAALSPGPPGVAYTTVRGTAADRARAARASGESARDSSRLPEAGCGRMWRRRQDSQFWPPVARGAEERVTMPLAWPS